jgi:hypothetical protein
MWSKTQMKFSHALDLIIANHKLARTGWNGKNMYVSIIRNFGSVEPFFILTQPAKTNTWVPSVSDLLSDDWVIFPETPLN